MNDFNQKGKVVVTCKDRFAPYLEQEIIALGFEPEFTFRTRVELNASLNECIYLNMHLRTASHVLFEIKSFYLRHADDIYRRIKALPWEEYFTNSTYFSVSSHVDNDSVDNPLFVNVRVKDAIVDRFRDNTGERPNSGSEYEGAVLQLFWKETQASLYINTSGETIAKHGYRKIPGQAPMLEALASATVMATGWNGEGVFLNPMCGSGTVAIEAALMATNRFPGLFRDHYSFMHFIGYEDSVYQQYKKELEAKTINPVDCKIIASDISNQAVLISQENAKAAGVAEWVDFETVDFKECTVPETDNGIVFLNPEYGERLGETEELIQTYGEIGDFMKKRCAGYKGYVFTGNLDLSKKVGLKAKRRIEFYNGTIDCRLLQYELYKGSRELKEGERPD
ncbi:MAG: class I SAM-dependent RNA methyltransferase [Anditalea sp.]